LPAVSHDFALRGAIFSGSGADFARVYPRPLYKKALATPLPTLPSAESAVMPLKHGIATVAFSQTKKPAPGVLDHARGLEHQLLHHRLDAPALGNIFANEGQTGVGAEVVGQFFYDKVGHDVAHLQGEQNFTPKSLIYKDKSTFI
jgi:hypothetical protein